MSAALLEVRELTMSFGGIVAVNQASLRLAEGELVGLIGPNGSGKTTLLNLVTGFFKPAAGTVILSGADITGRAPHRVFRAGIARMFQHVKVFGRLSAAQNLEVAGRCAGLDAVGARALALELLGRLGLASHAEHDVAELSGGQQKLVEFGACFMSRPRLVVLDEPFAAIHVTIRQVMLEVIRERHRAGQAFLVVSHDIPAIMRLCPRTVCMNAGAVIADGATDAVMREPGVVEAYLGSHAR